ncbi:hypothetical protein [Streptomyces sp. NPDC048565]|uniref:hypothetical protein n=1 Tax=Streptomyces sp. NPDC048565 TaxID=3155266 RepID=UPI003425DF06
MWKSSRTAASAALLCGLALLAVGCDAGRDYATPEDVCGVPVGKEEIEPLLPDGEKLVVDGEPLADLSGMCYVTVDSDKGVTASVERTDRLYDPMGKLVAYKFANRKKMSALPFDGAGAVGDKNFVISARCDTAEVPYLTVSVGVGERAEKDVEKRRADIERFALSFVPAVKKEMACTA